MSAPKKRAKPKPKPKPPARPSQPTKCLRCDGTGQICDECGESEAYGCDCGEGFSDCADCMGTGE